MWTRRKFLAAAGALSSLATLPVSRLSGSQRRRELEDIVKTPTVDFETHLNDTELYRAREIEDVIPVDEEDLLATLNRRGWHEGMPGYEANYRRYHDYRSRSSIELKARFMFDELDEAGIDMAVHQMVDHSVKPSNIGRHYRAGFDRMMADAVRIREQYAGRLITFVGIDPRSGRADAVRRFEVAVKDYGCKGLGEVVLQQFETYPHDKPMYPLYEKCIEFNVPFVGNCEGPAPYTMPKEGFSRTADLSRRFRPSSQRVPIEGASFRRRTSRKRVRKHIPRYSKLAAARSYRH